MGSWMYEAGKTEENPNAKGSTLIVNKNCNDYTKKRKHSDRIISGKINLHREMHRYKLHKSMPL